MSEEIYEFELEGPWSRFLVGILDILLGWCLFWTCRADLDAQANGRALERIEKRLDAAAGGPDSLEEFVVLSLHAEDDSTTRTAAATKNQEL